MTKRSYWGNSLYYIFFANKEEKAAMLKEVADNKNYFLVGAFVNFCNTPAKEVEYKSNIMKWNRKVKDYIKSLPVYQRIIVCVAFGVFIYLLAIIPAL